jgi:hypothetical protein
MDLTLAAQAVHQAEEGRKQAARATARKFVVWLSAALVVAGVGMALASAVEEGLALAGTGIAITLMYEIRRAVGRLVAAMFRMH